MYEFEKNKANNLILYGITTKHPETSDSLKNRIANVFRDHLNIRREITIQKATRVHTGIYTNAQSSLIQTDRFGLEIYIWSLFTNVIDTI